mmetsp:Transcript_9172/g.18001  ORF Transcript_9172/g.18001 Transcript_9172/m.18001 type:complete len:226 (-) Transcript_9172:593-1270(-)
MTWVFKGSRPSPLACGGLEVAGIIRPPFTKFPCTNTCPVPPAPPLPGFPPPLPPPPFSSTPAHSSPSSSLSSPTPPPPLPPPPCRIFCSSGVPSFHDSGLETLCPDNTRAYAGASLLLLPPPLLLPLLPPPPLPALEEGEVADGDDEAPVTSGSDVALDGEEGGRGAVVFMRWRCVWGGGKSDAKMRRKLASSKRISVSKVMSSTKGAKARAGVGNGFAWPSLKH